MKLDGDAIAKKVMMEVRQKSARLKERGIRPGLTAIRVGDDSASELYVSRKMRACEEAGIRSKSLVLPDATTEEDLLAAIRAENDDPETSGILVQLPLPAAIDTQHIIESIAPAKDVDGFHPFNVGRVATGVGGFASCTPKGIIRLLDEFGIDVKGKDAVVVGASKIVGRPMGGLLLNRLATVTTCHIATRDLAEHTRRADLLVVAVGRAGLITKEMVKKGVVIVDVGINRVPDASSPRGSRVVGDVAPSVRDVAYAWTPVPGGIGPMTVAMLLENTVIAAEALEKGLEV
jgi:methylenetetrahydrofolate dehydrogenase (NADP+) / methenyltetrahydrofolate cyclohydrolase